MKTLLFIIDMQNDFCNPVGSLYVPGADKDAERLARFINRRSDKIDDIILTQDNHQVMDIAHPCFWVNAAKEHPQPYTVITFNDVKTRKWIPAIYEKETADYLQKLETAGEYPHTIWPEHCIWGTEGAAVYPPLMKEIENWARKGNMFEIVSKGTYPLTEHFGAFRANIPAEGIEETQMNMNLVNRFRNYDEIFIAGEAKSHCVANTIKQLFDFSEIFPKITILEDCMSNVAGCETIATAIYKKAKEMGANFRLAEN